MKFKPVECVIVITLIVSVAMGALLTKSITPTILELSNDTVALSLDGSYMARDIRLYTQSADAIILGEVIEVGEPYLREDRGLTSQQNIQIDMNEILKGDIKLASFSVLIEGGQSVLIENDAQSVISEDETALFTTGENVLIFLGMNSHGDYVVFAGPYGKYLIDENNNVSSVGDFKMPLVDLKAKIQEVLLSPTTVQ